MPKTNRHGIHHEQKRGFQNGNIHDDIRHHRRGMERDQNLQSAFLARYAAQKALKEGETMCNSNLRSCEAQLRYASTLLPDEKRILKSYRNDRKLSRMMDCKQVNKFGRGTHVYQPVKKQKRIKFLNLETADLYVRSGAVLLSDCVSKERIIMDTNGRLIGFIRNDVMLKLFRKYAFDAEKQLGTNKTKYRFAV